MRCSAPANSRKQTANTRQIKLRINSSFIRTHPKNQRPGRSAAASTIVLQVRRCGKPKVAAVPGPMDIGRCVVGRRCPSRRRFVVAVHNNATARFWALQYEGVLFRPRVAGRESNLRLVETSFGAALDRNMGSIDVRLNRNMVRLKWFVTLRKQRIEVCYNRNENEGCVVAFFEFLGSFLGLEIAFLLVEAGGRDNIL